MPPPAIVESQDGTIHGMHCSCGAEAHSACLCCPTTERTVFVSGLWRKCDCNSLTYFFKLAGEVRHKHTHIAAMQVADLRLLWWLGGARVCVCRWCMCASSTKATSLGAVPLSSTARDGRRCARLSSCTVPSLHHAGHCHQRFNLLHLQLQHQHLGHQHLGHHHHQPARQMCCLIIAVCWGCCCCVFGTRLDAPIVHSCPHPYVCECVGRLKGGAQVCMACSHSRTSPAAGGRHAAPARH